MAGYNRVILVGNLTRDPDHKQLASGQAVCRLGLATNRQFKNKQTGTMVQEVCFIDIDVWGVQAESCNQYLQKGSPVLVEGRLKFDTWEDQSGQTRSKHSIVADRVVFLSSASEASEGVSDTASASSAKGDAQKASGPETELEKELYSQIEGIKKKNAAKAAAAKKESGTGEIKFKDEPPFEDELPF
ncbi:single-stranded DNA-binding protein [Candidatus Dependentiae bacterium]|nr:MAG: single-stranded DNA-binding protein [Candidatus Dependentiae bacterium]